ncbi:hypothetical protein J8F10_08675 [Gemmata sp. G18]|uniref:SH3 domain-containing protein n=1 Tax=Gemmata palustris TaxID=2822762 RepID=A0ABS5BNU7_9BACT|nr:hypothetical protein [Gemmata palustris]MBP3955352.1 hypothetical protein [Gemmata palustris]
MSEEYSLVMKFLDASESFCNGYEMGMLHMQMQAGEIIEGRTVHTANREQIEMLARSSIANRHGYALEWKDSGVEGWVYLTALPAIEPHGPRLRFKVFPGGLS